MKVDELRELEEDQLEDRMRAARRELYELRFKHAVGQLENSSQISKVRHDIARIMTVLSERERRIFEARRLADEPITLEELADAFGVSRERVRQIEVRAFEKVQKAVKSRVAAMESPAPLQVH